MRVLIVEDEQMVARRLERLLRQVLGAQLSAVRIASCRSKKLAFSHASIS